VVFKSSRKQRNIIYPQSSYAQTAALSVLIFKCKPRIINQGAAELGVPIINCLLLIRSRKFNPATITRQKNCQIL